MRIDARNVDEFMAKIPPERRDALEAIRAMIRTALPDAEENMIYGMPTYSGHTPIVAFNSQKNYMSLYVNPEIVARHRTELSGLDCGKSCIRFRRLDQLPLDTIEQMLKEAADTSLC